MAGGILRSLSVHDPPHNRQQMMTMPQLSGPEVYLPNLAPPVQAPDHLLILNRRAHRDAVAIQLGVNEDAWRRGFNLVVAAIGLVLSLPIMAVTALAIVITSRRPVFYTQVRIGMNRRRGRCEDGHPRRRYDYGGRPFEIYKFRTMDIDAEKRCGAVWASPNDPRVTRLGRFLRRYRLDELPQFLNVLKGEMNVVGPRPERPRIFAELRQTFREYPLRQRVRPGITGLAQINQSYDASMDDVRRKLRYDLDYLWTQGVLTDLRILLQSIPAVLFRCPGW
jgi:lipopolysaccharide/colanic/teichoic acid biosynthesis glycosyltransferase